MLLAKKLIFYLIQTIGEKLMFKKTPLFNWALALLMLAPAGVMAGPFSDIYVFGDSLSDQGNLYQASTALYPSTGASIRPADDHYYDGRFSNGEVYPGLLAQSLGSTSSATLLGGNNYAYGGTRTHYNRVESTSPYNGPYPQGAYPWTLTSQTQAFINDGVNDPNGLYIVFSGSNDMVDLVRPAIIQGIDATKPQSDNVVQAVSNAISAFRNAGAQYVLVPNLPDLGVVPGLLSANPTGSTLVSDTARALAVRYNNDLNAMLDQVTGLTIIRFDFFSFLNSVVSNPAAFGLTNSTTPCYTGYVEPAGPNDTVCNDPESYVFYDREHPTTAFHRLMANGMLSAIYSTIPEPGSLALWCLAGVILVGYSGMNRRLSAPNGTA